MAGGTPSTTAGQDNGTGSPVHWINADQAESIVVPHGNALLQAQFERAGPDLFVRMPEGIGEDVGIVNYFGAEHTPDLISDGGARLLGGTVEKLAGPMAPGEFAQASGAALGDPVGQVTQIRGTVVVTRADGTEEQLQAGSPIYQDDVISSGADGAVGINFVDNSSMSMAANGRMVIDTLVFDSGQGGGQQVFDLIQGAFAFASGQIGAADPDNVLVRSPVATIGIRGTRFAVNVDQVDAETTVTLFEGAVLVRNDVGEQVLTEIGDSTVVSTLSTPPSPIFQMDAATQQLIYGDALLFLSELPTQQNQDQENEAPPEQQEGDNDQQQDASLDVGDLDSMADGLDDLDTAAGPGLGGGGAGIDSDFLSVLDPLNGGGMGSSSGSLPIGSSPGSTNSGSGLGGPTYDSPQTILTPSPTTSPSDSGGLRSISGGFGGQSFVEYSFGSGLSGSITGNAGGYDTFAINASSYNSNSTWSIGSNSSGQVVLTESSTGSQVYLDEVEHLTISTGSQDDSITLGDLSNTDIADETVEFNTGSGDDYIDGSDVNKRVIAFGEAGNDTLIGSQTGDSLYGGSGNDTLVGNGSSLRRNVLDGGEGDDIVVVSFAEGDQGNEVIGGTGVDMLRLVLNQAALSDPAIISALIELADAIANPPESGLIEISGLNLSLSGIEVLELRDETGLLIDIDEYREPEIPGLVGTDGDDVLVDNTNLNEIHGLDGNDLILAGNGSDFVYGGGGNDTIYGGKGDDAIAGGSGNDRILAEAGDDVVLIDDGSDFVDLGTGNDLAAIDLRDDAVIDATIVGGKGDDTVRFMLDDTFAERLSDLKADLAAAKEAFDSGDISPVRLDSLGVTIEGVEHLEVQVEGHSGVLSIDDVLAAENWQDLFPSSGGDAGGAASQTVTQGQEDALSVLIQQSGLPPMVPAEPVD